MSEHQFGGPWTELKLDAVEYYLQCFVNALSGRFDLWYIDGFAGSGSRTAEVERGGVFEGTPLETVTETFAGSARRALAIRPPFDHFRLIEQIPDFTEALRSLGREHASADVQCFTAEANTALQSLVQQPPWNRTKRRNARGVVFLDPYALQVNWATLQALAATRALDVWYLFPLRDVTRQLALKFSGVGPKNARLDAVLGPTWRDDLYRPVDPVRRTSLFDLPFDDSPERSMTKPEIEAWFKRRLETEFGWVSEPLPLLSPKGGQIFSLFLAVSSKSDRAIKLARQFSDYVMRNYGPRRASRRKSAP